VKESLVAGIRSVEHAAVDESNTISFLGEGLRVYSTPSMVHDVEYACYRLIGEHLDPCETSLGVHVAVDHLGATPIGHRVEVAVTVRSVEGRKVTLDAEVRDAVEVVGKGMHVRVVTEVERLRPTVGSKRERLDAAARGAELAR
jgi:predicted thioesterase